MAKLLFLQNIYYEYMGPMYISSYIKNKHIVKMAIGRNVNDFTCLIESFKPDLLAFSVMTGSHIWALNIAEQLKTKYSVRTLFGGAHPTFFPEILNENAVDIICVGEGEEATMELLDCLDAGRDYSSIANLQLKKNGSQTINSVRNLESKLDKYPFPDRTLYDQRHFDREIANIITSRGCPYNCSFCFEPSMKELYKGKGHYLRARSQENVIEELQQLKNNGARLIYFCDDVFGINNNWLAEFLKIYKHKIGLEFMCLLRADIIAAHPELAGLLYDAGCRRAFFGIETGSDYLRNHVLQKNLKNDDIIRAADLLHSAGIKFRTYNILGLPGESIEDAYNTIKLNVTIKADYPWCSIFTPYPRTKLADYAISNGYLDSSFNANKIPNSFFIASSLNIKHKKEIENLHKFFQTAVIWPKTLWLIKYLIKLSPNIIFSLWFGIVYIYVYIRSERRKIFKTFILGLKNYSALLTRN